MWIPSSHMHRGGGRFQACKNFGITAKKIQRNFTYCGRVRAQSSIEELFFLFLPLFLFFFFPEVFCSAALAEAATVFVR